MTGRPTWAPATASCGPSTCCARNPTSIACSRSSRASASPTAATRARPAAPATWVEPTPPRSSPAGSGSSRAFPPSRRPPASLRSSHAKDLTGWEGDKELWSVRDGVLIGHSPGINHNEFLATTRSLCRLRPLAQLPDGRRQGQQRRPVSQRPGAAPRNVGLSGRYRRGLLGLLVRRVAPQQGAGASVGERAEGTQQDRLEPLHRASRRRPDHHRSGRGRVRYATARPSPAWPGPACSPCRSTPAVRWKSSSRT